MHVQPYVRQQKPAIQKVRPSQLEVYTLKSTYSVLLLNRGNPDLGQSPEQPLPSSRCYKKPVNSVLEARRLCLEYIQKYKLGGGNWCGGLVTNERGNPVAQISYNGRIWDPSLTPHDVKQPFAPILAYDRRQNRFIICYSHIYKEMTMRLKELTGEFRFMDPFDDNRGLLITLVPASDSTVIKATIYPTLFQGRQGWIASTNEPLTESIVEFI